MFKPLLVLPALLWGAAQAAEFSLQSSDISDGKAMSKTQEFAGFGCNGNNISPQLSWSDAPAGTQSFAVTVYDPDAPTGSGWWHWLLINLPKETQSLASGAGNKDGVLPAGALQTRTDFGSAGWGGPCPPPGHGTHHYQFTVWALKVPKLDLAADSTAALVGYMLNANALGKASITATYSR